MNRTRTLCVLTAVAALALPAIGARGTVAAQIDLAPTARAVLQGEGGGGTVEVAPAAAEGVDVVASSAVTYQGLLRKAGALFTGTCDAAFRLFGSAGGSDQIGAAITTTVSPVNGLFTIALNFGTTPFEGDARHLAASVRCPAAAGGYTVLSPRTELRPVPVAHTLRPGATISATTSGNLLNIENYQAGSGRAAYFRNTGGSSSATLRVDNEGSSWGVYVESNGTGIESRSTQATGVLARRTATTGTLPAIAGYTASGSGNAVAILGEVSSSSPGSSSTAVRGDNNGTGGSGIGVWGSQAGSGYGVYGTTSGAGYGVYGTSVGGRGVYGRSASGIGVYGSSDSSRGVYGESDTNVAGYFTSNGIGTGAPTIYANNTNPDASEPAGIAIYARNAGDDATIVARNSGTGDTFRSLNAAGNGVAFAVRNNGRVWTSAVQIYGGGDLAERFETAAVEMPKPGTLMVIDEKNPGKLKPSLSAYDTKVAGIVSGAGGVNPGMVLHQEGVLDGGIEVAMVGRVYVKADARGAAIKPGDLLTSSDLPGHAMKAANHAKAQGAIIGKAMSALGKGEIGLVLVLVNLQ